MCTIILLLCQNIIVQEGMDKLNLLRSFQTTMLAWRESHGPHSFHLFFFVCNFLVFVKQKGRK